MRSLVLFPLLVFLFSPSHAAGIVYKVAAQRYSNQPIVSKAQGSTWDFNYNAAVYSYKGALGLLVRVQNLKNASVPFAVGASNIATAQVTFTTNGNISATQTTLQTFVPNNTTEKCGVEDPRVSFFNGLYYLFYTAYDCKQAMLSSAFTATPTDPNSWTRSGFALPNRTWSKSGAALYATTTNGLKQHYLFWGDSSSPAGGIGIATAPSNSTNTAIAWTDTFNYLLKIRNNSFDSNLVESGPSPVQLQSGDFLFLYNSARDGFPSAKPQWTLQYNLGFAILDGKDPTNVLQRSDQPILIPSQDWEIGNSTMYLTPNVVFLEGLAPDPNGCKFANVAALLGPEYVANAECFFGVYGGSDSDLGAVQIVVSSNASMPTTTAKPIPTTTKAADSTALSITILLFSTVLAFTAVGY